MYELEPWRQIFPEINFTRLLAEIIHVIAPQTQSGPCNHLPTCWDPPGLHCITDAFQCVHVNDLEDSVPDTLVVDTCKYAPGRLHSR